MAAAALTSASVLACCAAYCACALSLSCLEITPRPSSAQQAEAAIQQGRANENLASLSAGRMSNLLGRGVISKQDNDNAQAQYAAQQANTEALVKAAAAMRSSVAAAEANLARLGQLKTYQTVRTPFDGVITLRNVDTGALVNEGSTLLFRVAQTGTLRTYINLPQ